LLFLGDKLLSSRWDVMIRFVTKGWCFKNENLCTVDSSLISVNYNETLTIIEWLSVIETGIRSENNKGSRTK